MNDIARNEIDKRLALARTAAREAGKLALGYFRDRSSLRYEAKANAQDVVSVADKESELLMRGMIAARFPDDGMLGEEYGHQDGTSGYIWVMDPIDGTSAFVFGIPAWCVSVAITRGNETVAGVIYDPTNDELFSASLHSDFTVNDRASRLDRSLTLENGLVGIGANHRVPSHLASGAIHRLVEGGGMFIRSGSGALMLAYVAAGRLAGYYEPHMNAWDCLAGLHLVERAGGWAGDFSSPEHMRRGGVVIAAGYGARDGLLAIIDPSEKALLGEA